MSWNSQVLVATRQVDDCIKIVKSFVMPMYGESFYEFPVPVHPAVAMGYCAHESGHWNKKLKQWECQRWITTKYPEIGLLQLTMRAGDNEVGTFGIFPLDPRSHIWAAQEAFWEGVDLIRPTLVKYGFADFDRLGPQNATCLLLLVRSIGMGCVRGLIRRAAETSSDDSRPMVGIVAWLRQPNADTTPFDGSQDTELVRLRTAWCWQLCTRCGVIGAGGISNSALQRPVTKPGNLDPLPADFFRNVDAYVAKAKREGYAPTGPWPM